MQHRISITLSACALAMAVGFTPAIAWAQQDAQPASAALKVLDHYAGHWQGERTNEFTDGGGGTTTATATEQLTGRWLINGRVMELSAVLDTDDQTMRYMVLLTHDENANHYRGWALTAGGRMMEVTGKWNADTKVMKWASEDGRQTVESTYVNRDKMTTKQVIKNAGGDVMFRQTGESKRADAAPLVKPLNADGPAGGPMQKIAGAAGQWTFETLGNPDANNQRRPVFSGKTTGRFILGGHYLRHDRTIDFLDQQMTMIEITWFDTESNQYRRISMAPRGRVNEGTGKFDDKTKTMTWQATAGAEMQWTTKTQYGQADEMTSDTTAKSPDGSRTFNMTTVSRRVKPTPKSDP